MRKALPRGSSWLRIPPGGVGSVPGGGGPCELLPPGFEHRARLRQRGKVMLIQAPIPQFAVEALDEAVLDRAPGADEVEPDPAGGKLEGSPNLTVTTGDSRGTKQPVVAGISVGEEVAEQPCFRGQDQAPLGE